MRHFITRVKILFNLFCSEEAILTETAQDVGGQKGASTPGGTFRRRQTAEDKT